MKFIHTADWQLGKPFARIEDAYKRSLVQKARIHAVARIAALAKAESADFVLVAGDLFDSPSASKATVAEACATIGEIGVPVYVIPGNHDHGGPGSLWDQAFFQRERSALAPNLSLLSAATPLELDGCVLFPCPLLRRLESGDRTDWLRDSVVLSSVAPKKPRIILAHGSTQDFSGVERDEETDGASSNCIDLDRLPMTEIDYVALGDWHGTKEITAKAWYSGTPEPDRFPKGGGQQPGHVLVVEARRGEMPQVRMVKTASLNWYEIAFDFGDDTGVERLAAQLAELLGQRTNEDLLKLSLKGSLGIEAANRLEQQLEALEARLLRLKLNNGTAIAPTDEEVEALTLQTADPLIGVVAQQLVAMTRNIEDEESGIAAIALRELHAAYQQKAHA